MVQPSYPGVYIVEVPSGVRTITGVSTSVAAFIGYTARGPENKATLLFSWADFERNFGGLAIDSDLSYAVQSFFANGGSQAYVVRTPKSDAKSAGVAIVDTAQNPATAVVLTASSTGTWANNLVADINYDPPPATAPANTATTTFNLTLTDLVTGTTETFSGLGTDNTQTNYYKTRLNDPDNGSDLVVAYDGTSKVLPVRNGTVSGDLDNATIAKIQWDQTKAYSLLLSTDDNPQSLNAVEVDVVNKEAGPDTLVGLARQIELRANATLRTLSKPGLAVRCQIVNGTVAGKQALKLIADFDQTKNPGTLDVVLTAGAGPTPLPGISFPTPIVSRFCFGSSRKAAGQGIAVLPAPAGDGQTFPTPGVDGKTLPKSADLIGDPAKFTGLYALDKVSFNLLSIPEATRPAAGNPNALDPSVDPNAIFSAAMTYCVNRRAFLLIDPPPDVSTVDKATIWRTAKLTVTGLNGATYFPRLRIPDPLNNFNLRTVAPSGIVAGLYARTDASRGVWKAPAGIDASLAGVAAPVYVLSDAEQGVLNPIGLNCFRAFPVYGNVSFGARTLVGADAQASDWKYVPVRRTALYIEESLYRGTQWAVFEPNDESLWAQIRLNLGAFMHSLFVKGAFQGKSPQEAYLVKCDSETTTQNDINSGIVNILVGFAPLRPAEFVILQIKQLAGQIQT
jgi:phage tail sheath protein FI